MSGKSKRKKRGFSEELRIELAGMDGKRRSAAGN